MEKILRHDGSELTPEELQTKKKEIEVLSGKLASKEQELKTGFQSERHMLIDQVNAQIRSASAEVAKVQGLKIILQKEALVGLYDEALDITKAISAQIEKQG